MKKYVVYKVTNKINGKLYIGKTYNFEKRKREHILNKNDNLPFHNALKKYGEENFEWEIIDTSDNDEEIKQKEIYWIKKLNTCIKSKKSNGYNITVGGEGGVSWNSEPVVQFDFDGNYIEEFESASCASLKSKADRHMIIECAKGNLSQSGGYQWKFKKDVKSNRISNYNKKSSHRTKQIVQLDLNGYLINVFDSVTDASKKLNLNRANISSCLCGYSKRCGGYQWIYFEDYNPSKDYSFKGVEYKDKTIFQLDDKNNIINTFNNCSEASRAIGEPTSVHKQIHKALKSGHKCKGFRWVYSKDYQNHANTEVTI